MVKYSPKWAIKRMYPDKYKVNQIDKPIHFVIKEKIFKQIKIIHALYELYRISQYI